MGTSLKVHPATGTNNVDRRLSAPERKLLGQLVKLWKSEADRSLKTRHVTGRWLNRQVGPPIERQPHGGRVLELFGEKLGIALSDLNRMGWFSYLFPDLSAFRRQHSKIDSWTKFKTALPGLKPSKGGKARKPVSNPPHLAVRGVAKAFTNLTSMLNRLVTPPVGAEREKLVAVVQELAKAASRRLKIRVEVAARVEESKSVATKRLNRVA